MAQDAASAPCLFEAVIRPHRSLSPRGLRILILVICTLSFIITTVCWWLGAWPVAGFNGGEILLAVMLLRLNARRARAVEIVELRERSLRILRVDSRGVRRERVLDAAWLRVRLQERLGLPPLLLLGTRGREEEIGADLGEDERRDLARALGEAIHALRHPTFDNPQLREAGTA